MAADKEVGIEIEFLGAAGEVTGSCHLLRVGDRKILLDCGLIQGGPRDAARNREPFPFDPAGVDAAVLSHAHIDHSGRLPLLVKSGFRGPVYTQQACRDLCRIMLADSGFIHEKDAQWENRKRERKGLKPVEPLYTVADARAALAAFRPLPYDHKQEILPGVTVRLRDAGHILGSAVVELWLSEGQQTRKLVFSGDLGHTGAPVLRNPAPVGKADLVLLESTYGDRAHRPWGATLNELRGVLDNALDGGGNILVPAFAVGRTQELLYLLGKYRDDWNLARWMVFLDSPLAIEATEIYLRHSGLFDDQALTLFADSRLLPLLPNLRLTRSAEESMAINRIHGGAMIIAASGMCEGGRIKHHLKHNVWRRDCQVIFVGYQAYGTLGRALVDGARRIRLWGETVQVNAKIHTVGGFSAHADQPGLLAWYDNFSGRPPVVLVHGEPGAADALAAALRAGPRASVRVARRGERLDLLGNFATG